MNYDSASLTSNSIALPAPQKLVRLPRSAATPPITRRFMALRRQLSDGQSWETVAWIALGFASLAVLFLSLG